MENFQPSATHLPSGRLTAVGVTVGGGDVATGDRPLTPTMTGCFSVTRTMRLSIPRVHRRLQLIPTVLSTWRPARLQFSEAIYPVNGDTETPQKRGERYG